VYFGITLSFIVYAIIHYLVLHYKTSDYTCYRQYFFITGIFLAIYLPKIIMMAFIIIENIILFCIQFISFIFQNRRHYEFVKKVKRFRFISWIGIVAGIAMFVYVLYGMIVMRVDYKVVEQTISFRGLPESFNGTRIVLFSDTHLGSFYSTEEVEKGIDLIKAQSPDLILFAGDMVNVGAEETKPYIEMFSELKAPMGKFSILGNHDMGDYLKFNETENEEEKIKALVEAEKEMGFTVLLNDHVLLHKGNDSLALIGVDSWGLPPFKKYGKLDEAMHGLDPRVFRILLSHIPSHWEAEVEDKTNINLTLSGHTHALQFGINQFGIKWSPVKYRYPEWMGLYQWGAQYLYVNPGFGYIGFPGRIGIRPEITVITLVRG
jgi:hypothetical protein